MLDSSNSDERAAWVRQNAGSAAIAALLMLYFGFAALAAPTGTGLFERSNLILFHTVRIGGIAMAVIAVGSLLGYPLVLAVDALVSTCVGVSLILSGGGMLIGGGGGLQNALLILFGMMFIGAGLRNGRLYAHLTHRGRGTSHTDVPKPSYREPPAPSHDPSRPSLAARLAERSRQKPDPATATDATKETPSPPLHDPEPPGQPADEAGPEEPDAPKPEGGFLASFGRKDDPGT